MEPCKTPKPMTAEEMDEWFASIRRQMAKQDAGKNRSKWSLGRRLQFAGSLGSLARRNLRNRKMKRFWKSRKVGRLISIFDNNFGREDE